MRMSTILPTLGVLQGARMDFVTGESASLSLMSVPLHAAGILRS